MPGRGSRTGAALSLLIAGVAAASPGRAADMASSVPPVTLTPFGEAMSGNFAYDGIWFGLGDVPPSSFDGSKVWSEEWLEFGARAEARAGDIAFYGGLSVGASFTLGTDSFDETNQHAVLLENAYAGVKSTNPGDAWNFDLSAGQQEFGLGTGMLIWQGAGNGFERGGLNIVQRLSWSMAAVAEITGKGHAVQGFYLDPNEIPSNETDTRMVGAAWRYDRSPTTFAGAYYLNVLNSKLVYPLPDLPLFIPDGRDGLNAVQAYARLDGAEIGLANAWARAEAAYEWNDDLPGTSGMSAWAAYGEAGYRFVALPWTPALSYGYATFSGDDPSTSTYERFDPLYYGNGLNNWWFGANGSYAFLNSNINFHRLSLQLVASEQDFLMFQNVITSANELNSPIQFGQSARLDLENGGLVVGAPAYHLSTEIYGEWTHMFTPTFTATLWGSVAWPGDGITEIAPGVSDETWLGAGIVLSVRTP